jgi:hypothetical protein
MDSFPSLLLASSAFSISTIKAGLNIYRAQPDISKMAKNSIIPIAISAFAFYNMQATATQILNQPGLYGRTVLAVSGVGIGCVMAPLMTAFLEAGVVMFGYTTGKFNYRGGFLIPAIPPAAAPAIPPAAAPALPAAAAPGKPLAPARHR